MRPKKSKIKSARKLPSPTTKEFEKLLQEASAIQHYQLRLYITGTTARSIQAIANIRSLCEEYLAGHYDLEVIDIYQQPGAAAKEQIIAAPTLVKQLPMPSRRFVGNLSDRDKVLVGLEISDKNKGPKPAAKATRWMKV